MTIPPPPGHHPTEPSRTAKTSTLTRIMVALIGLFVIFAVIMAAGDVAGLWDTAAIFERIDAFLTNPAGL